MDILVDQIAEVLYSSDAQIAEWNFAGDEDREYFTSVADVVIDTVTTFLQGKNPDFAGALMPAIEILSLQSEAARLKRLAR